jgi:hypothetical protein
MRKKIFIGIIGIITIIYIIIGSFLFLNIQFLETPEITLNVELFEIDSNEAILKTIIDVNNPNEFEIIMKNFKIITYTPNEYEVANVKIKGGVIGSNKNESFSKEILINFNGNSPELLTSKITGDIGANFLFITKTIPIKINIITNIKNLLNKISLPIVNLNIDNYKIIKDGIQIDATVDVENKNSFSFYLENNSANIESEKNEILGNLEIIGGEIPANSKLTLNCSGSLKFKALDAKKLKININGKAGVQIAGYKKNLSYNLKSSINIPDLDKLLLSEKVPTFLSIKFDEKLTLRGIIFYVTLEINNSYKVDLEVRDIIFRICTVVGDKHTIIGENDLIENIIAEPGKIGSTTCNIIIPYSKIIPFNWKTDWIMGSVSGRVSIRGINQSAYLEIRGYQSLHPIR